MSIYLQQPVSDVSILMLDSFAFSDKSFCFKWLKLWLELFSELKPATQADRLT